MPRLWLYFAGQEHRAIAVRPQPSNGPGNGVAVPVVAASAVIWIESVAAAKRSAAGAVGVTQTGGCVSFVAVVLVDTDVTEMALVALGAAVVVMTVAVAACCA